MWHSGGVAGAESAPMTRSVPTVMFSGAPKFHEGRLPNLAPSEIPAIIKRDEGVFTPAQMKALGPAGGNTNVTVAPSVNVNMPQGATQEEGERFGKAITRQLEAMVQDQIRRSVRPGGSLNPSGLS